MTHDAPEWVTVQVELAEEVAELAAAFLVEEGATGVLEEAVARADGHPAPVRLETHLPVDRGAEVAAELQHYLLALAQVFPAAASARVTHAPLAPVDWEAALRDHHRPQAVGRRLMVAPPWDVPAAPDREILIVRPGMAFGTGQHATTRTCLLEVEAAAEAGACSGLDVGTGSGILAAAMDRLGLSPVVATDVDPSVLPLARETCRLNRATAVRLLAGRAHAVRTQFDLVVANLLADALVEDAAMLARRVTAGGRLVVSGLLAEQVPAVVAVYPRWRVTCTRAEGPWRTLRLQRVR